MVQDPLENTQEILLDDNDLIVSKTCTKGRITYANRKFMAISGFSEQQLLDQPHNIIRHPDMPKAVYRLMWQALKQGHEFFGFVKNLCSDGRFYWVFANVTPDIDDSGQVRGYYSVRRKASTASIAIISSLYQQMNSIERAGTGSIAIERSVDYLIRWLDNSKLDYCPAMIQLYRNGFLPESSLCIEK